MGRAIVRAAVSNYFTNAGIPFVGMVYSARPIVINENDYERTMSAGTIEFIESGNGSGAVMVVNIPDDKRVRKTLTGRGAVDDTNVHTIVLEIFFGSTGGEGISAQSDHDQLIDAVVTAIRSDPLLGTGGKPIWSAGEFDFGVVVEQAEPYTGSDGTTVFIPSTIRFQAWEWIAGSGV